MGGPGRTLLMVRRVVGTVDHVVDVMVVVVHARVLPKREQGGSAHARRGGGDHDGVATKPKNLDKTRGHF